MKPYTLTEAQALVNDAVLRARPRHAFWSNLEKMYRTGSMGSLTASDLSGTLFDTMTAADLEQVNLILPRIRLQIARLTARDPRPVARATSGGPQSEDLERVVEAVLEYFWDRNYATPVVRDLAQDLVVCGNAFAKVMWWYDEEEVELDDADIEQQLVILLELERQAALLEGRPMRPVDEIREGLVTTTTVVTDDEPYIKYVRPVDIFVPASTRRIEETRWVAQRVIMPLAEAQQRYPNSTVTSTSVSNDHHLDDEVRQSETDDLAELWEFWDAGTRQLMVFQSDSDVACYDGDWPYSHRSLPFVHIANHRSRPSDFWAFGDLQQMAGLQERFNEVWTTIVDSTFRAGRKYLALKGTLDEEAVSALESDVDEQVVFIDGPVGENPSNLVVPMMRQPISGEVLNTQSQLIGLMDAVMAFNDFDTGGVGADRMSATAAAAVMNVSEQRATDKQLLLEEACSRIYMLMLSLCQEYLTAETVVRISGPNGTMWPAVTSEDLQGEFRIRVETGSLNAESRAQRRAEGVQMLTQVVPLLTNLGYDTDGMVRSALKRMGYSPDDLGLRQRAPEPVAAPASQPGPAGGPSTAMAMQMLSGLPAPTDMQEGGSL